MIRLLERCLAALGILVLLVSGTPIVSWWTTALAGPWDDPAGDTLVVLGGDVLDNGTIGLSSYWRTVYAARAFEHGEFRLIILSGGAVLGVTVAEAMTSFLRCSGVPASAFQLETQSTTTRENALFVKPLLEAVPGPAVLMTSDYHMFRAQRTFRKLGIQVRPRPIPDALKRSGSWHGRWGAFLDVTRETAAIAYYFARGWI